MKKSILAFFLILALAYPFIEPYLIRVGEVTVKSRDVPAQFDGRKIVFISDIHCGPLFSAERVTALSEQINGLHPDMVLLGGDYIYGKKRDDVGLIRPCISPLAGLKAPLGVFGVHGNHDNWASHKIIGEVLAEAGVVDLDNQAAWVESEGGRIRVGGVGDMWTETQNLEPTVEGTKQKDFIILLSHNPDYLDSLKDKRVDLVLSGHTHAGQINMFGLWASAPVTNKNYVSGIVETPYTKAIISNGIGETGLPIRFSAPPQIIVLKLEKI